ncbi:MAG: pyridoxamine 5'-phosphate oxidase family protein [Oscillospiraceae bacterium]|jgi:uncharacterized pyridoxamine 5'-phosphate oxidase family protein|nr:pyridoxamine 5'-phosphate oxidase family protein [Oscillospiraceae bacterium]
MSKAYDYLKKTGTFYIATVEGDQPRVRPFGGLADIDGKTYITLNKTKKVFAQLIANPKVELCGMYEGSNWVRISAKVVHDDSDATRAKVLEQNPNLGNMYKADDGIFAVFYLTEVSGKAESFGGAIEEF